MIFVAGSSIDTVGTHGIEGIRHRCNSRFFADLIPGQSVRIAFSVISFMMASCDMFCRRIHMASFQNFRAGNRMRFDDIVFRICKASGIVQDGIGNSDLSDVMKQGSPFQSFPLLFIPSERFGNFHGILTDPGGMTAGIWIFGIDGIHKGLNGLKRHLFNPAASFLRHRCLFGDFGIQTIRIFVFQQNTAVILHQRNRGKDCHACVNKGKTVHELGCIMHGNKIPDRRIEYYRKENGVINRQKDPVFDTYKVADSDRKKQTPQDRSSLCRTGNGIHRKGNNAENRGHKNRLLPVFFHTGKPGT